jgi:glycosyltransferase involved in cell wall biosynthesis
MNICLVIPTYWRREREYDIVDTDILYDHPTPLDEEGTLARMINSLELLETQEFIVLIVASGSNPMVRPVIETKVRNILKRTKPRVPIYLFTYPQLDKLRKLSREFGGEEFQYLLEIDGYSNIRNMTLILAHILNSDVVISLDDDEYFTNPKFISMALEHLGTTIDGESALAIAGYYVNPQGEYIVAEEKAPWAQYWNVKQKLNAGFRKIIGGEPRIKRTPFVFGGNMILHRKLFTKIPFDPKLTRGEDIDFLINAKMFGYSFFLDNKLSIVHAPPPKPHPLWRQIRADIIRFIYEREKLRTQIESSAQMETQKMVYITPEDLDPYPGAFLRDDLEEKINKCSDMLAEYYRSQRDEIGVREALHNKSVAQSYSPANPFKWLLKLQRDWEILHQFIAVHDTLRARVEQELLAKI